MASELGHLIKSRRLKAKISQTTLANNIGLASPQYISNIERGLNSMSPLCMKQTAVFLKIALRKLRDAHITDYTKKYDEKLGL